MDFIIQTIPKTSDGDEIALRIVNIRHSKHRN